MERYPRSTGFAPELIPALLTPATHMEDPPGAVEVVVQKGSEELCYISLAQIAALGAPTSALPALQAAALSYMTGACDSTDLFTEARRHISIDIRMVDGDSTHVAKRAGTDKVQEFERRLETYAARQPHPADLVRSVSARLESMGLPGASAPRTKYLPDGRLEGTDAEMLSRAIKALPDPNARGACSANFEMLAVQIWGWRYPALDDETKDRVLADFRALQVALSKKAGGAQVGCHNVTIRLLWHLSRAGIRCSAEMFRVPTSKESWANNLAQLGAPTNWRPGGVT